VVAAESSGSTTAAAGERSLAFVLGPGRSGTSTMAGALFHSGYHVPKAIKGNETNPVGFFEPRWVVNFHRRLVRSVGLRPLDQDPEAMRRLEGVLGDQKIRDELHDWLARRLERNGRLVIKDPRMVWFRDLWVDAATRLDVDPRFVIMLRHPSEVSSSRSQFYNSDQVAAVAGWINVALMTERLTAGSPRALVHYPQLTADWRTELTRLRDDLGLILDPPPEQRSRAGRSRRSPSTCRTWVTGPSRRCADSPRRGIPRRSPRRWTHSASTTPGCTRMRWRWCGPRSDAPGRTRLARSGNRRSQRRLARRPRRSRPPASHRCPAGWSAGSDRARPAA
jgi:hypothetical protein